MNKIAFVHLDLHLKPYLKPISNLSQTVSQTHLEMYFQIHSEIVPRRGASQTHLEMCPIPRCGLDTYLELYLKIRCISNCISNLSQTASQTYLELHLNLHLKSGGWGLESCGNWLCIPKWITCEQATWVLGASLLICFSLASKSAKRVGGRCWR